MKILKYGIVLLCIVASWGCSKGNSNSPVTIDQATGKHAVPNWKTATVHGGVDTGASKDMAACQECHGKDFAGGISKVSCLNTAGCHGAGVFSPHPQKPWRGGLVTHTLVKESNTPVCAICHTKGNNYSGPPLVPTYSSGPPSCFNATLCHGLVGHANDPQPWSSPANHGANSGATGRPGAKFSIQACQSCHATPSFGPNPLFTNPKAGMPGGCSSSGCHDKNAMLAHPYVWLPNRVAGITTSHATAQDLSSSCGLCHGTSLTGAASGGVAPSCTSASITFDGVTIRCHSNTTMATSPSYVECTSCHGGLSTGPNGASFPNISSAHPKHIAITAVTCSTCHNGAGNGTQLHANGTPDVSFLTTQAGATAAYSAATKTCTNVTCHGLSTTPAWTSKNQGCTTCHTDPPNTFRHSAHWAITTDIKCDACHNDGPGVATHMTQNPVVVGSPLPAKFNESGAVATYNPATGQCANVSCHGGKPNIVYGPSVWPAWKSATVFNQTNCYNCHLQRIGTDPGLTEVAYRAAVAAGTRPYIGPFSGAPSPAASSNNLHWGHFFLIGGLPPALCLNCHPTPGTAHFSRVTNGRRDLPRGFATVGGAATQITSYDSSTGTCVTVCHITPRTW